MPWVIAFIVSWVVFFVLIEKENFKYNLIGGLVAFTMATFVDWGGTHLGLYKFANVVIPWFGCSFFYKFGPIITMGILFSQGVPYNRWMKVLNILIFSSFFTSFEYLLGRMHVVKYLHWNITASIVVNILTFSTLTFVTINFIRPSLIRK